MGLGDAGEWGADGARCCGDENVESVFQLSDDADAYICLTSETALTG